MSELSYRRDHASFPFTNYPLDVQLLVLSKEDLHTLKRMTASIPSILKLYVAYPASILLGVTAAMGLQIRNLILTTHSLVATINAKDLKTIPDIWDIETYLADSLDTDAAWKVNIADDDSLGALNTIYDIDTEVASLVEAFAQDIYERACERDNPGAIAPPLVLSPTESHRLTRAFYRLK